MCTLQNKTSSATENVLCLFESQSPTPTVPQMPISTVAECGGVGWVGVKIGMCSANDSNHQTVDDEDPAEPREVIPDSDMPPYSEVPYTDPRSYSPGRRKDGKRLPRGKVPKKHRGLSQWRLSHMSETDLFAKSVTMGFLKDRCGNICFQCKKGSFAVADGRDGTGCAYVCNNRNYSTL